MGDPVNMTKWEQKVHKEALYKLWHNPGGTQGNNFWRMTQADNEMVKDSTSVHQNGKKKLFYTAIYEMWGPYELRGAIRRVKHLLLQFNIMHRSHLNQTSCRHIDLHII